MMEQRNEFENRRQASVALGPRHYPQEIPAILVCAIPLNTDSYQDIALWKRLKIDWLRGLLVLKNGSTSCCDPKSQALI